MGTKLFWTINDSLIIICFIGRNVTMISYDGYYSFTFNNFRVSIRYDYYPNDLHRDLNISDISSTSTLTPPLKPLQEEIVCGKNEFLRDPNNCSMFYQCAHGIPYHKSCQAELAFDIETRACLWPYQVKGCESVARSRRSTMKQMPSVEETAAQICITNHSYSRDAENVTSNTLFNEIVNQVSATFNQNILLLYLVSGLCVGCLFFLILTLIRMSVGRHHPAKFTLEPGSRHTSSTTLNESI